jgi:hypothetical protein
MYQYSDARMSPERGPAIDSAARRPGLRKRIVGGNGS